MALCYGVIGCGSISRFHFNGLEKVGARIKWICDLREPAARPWVQKFGARYTANYRDILADGEVDVVTVLSCSSMHKEMCLAAIDAGKAVVCEKTLTTSSDDALEVVRRAEQKGVIFYTSYMKRFLPTVKKAKELLPSLGTIMSAYIRAYQYWGKDFWPDAPVDGGMYPGPGVTSGLKKNVGGGILPAGGSHILDLVCFFFGRPRKLYARVHYPPDRDYDLQAISLIETPACPVMYEALMHPLKRIGHNRDSWDERIEINGTNGRLDIYTAIWDHCDERPGLLVHYDNATETAIEYRYPPTVPFDEAVAFYYHNIEQGRQGPQSRVTGYDVDELIDTMVLSSREGRAVDVKYRA